MVSVVMPRDFGMEVLVGSSPVLGSSFGNSTGTSPYSTRCSQVWTHATPVSCSIASSPKVIHAKSPTSTAVSNFIINDNNIKNEIKNHCSTITFCPQDIKSLCPFRAEENSKLDRSASLRESSRCSNRRRKAAAIECPDLQALKSCLIKISRLEKQPRSDTANDTICAGDVKLKKKVSFADASGQDLARIKFFENSDYPPKFSLAFLEQLTGGAKAVPVTNEWALAFPQPVANYISWKTKLEYNNVNLENVVVDEANDVVTGFIKVRNLGFKKSVIVRYTTNSWLSFEDVPAKFELTPMSLCSRSSYNSYDTFSFEIPLPDTTVSDKIEFCISFTCAGSTFWDNNDDKNYTIIAFTSKKENEFKPKYVQNVQISQWGQFAVWKELDICGSPYW